MSGLRRTSENYEPSLRRLSEDEFELEEAVSVSDYIPMKKKKNKATEPVKVKKENIKITNGNKNKEKIKTKDINKS